MIKRFWILIVIFGLLTACAGPEAVPTNPPTNPTSVAQEPSLVAIPSVAIQPTEAVPATPEESQPPTVEPQVTVVATGEPADDKALLPSPVYMLSSQPSGVQLMRVSNDLQAVTQITNEPNGIRDYAIADNGTIAYITGNTIVTVDQDGNNRQELFVGPGYNPNDSNDMHSKQISEPVWSADSTQLWFAFGGVNYIPATGGEPTNVLPHKLQTSELKDMFRYSDVYQPLLMSPDGSKLLIAQYYVPEGGIWGIMDVSTKAVTPIQSQAMPCCFPTWSINSHELWYSSDTFVMTGAGLWKADAASGAVQRVLGSDNGAPYLLVHKVEPMEDGSLLAFFKETSNEEEIMDFTQRQLTLSRINPDGTITPLRSDAITVGEVLWAHTSEGALVVPSFMAEAIPEWVPTDGSARTPLPITGLNLQWGK